MSWELSTFEKRFFRIILALVIIPTIGYVLYNKIFNYDLNWNNYFEYIESQQYDGIVINKFVDFNDHAIEKIGLDNNIIFNLISAEWYKKFDTGDYVLKEKGSLIIKLIKKNTQDTLYFDYRDIEIKN
jgi:hypothetical protein